MTKQQMIRSEIREYETIIKRLRLLYTKIELNKDDGNTIKECPECKTRNMHWNTHDTWCCACCGAYSK